MLSIEEEIKQKKFESAQQKALVNLLFTHGAISTLQHHTLKPFGLSIQQFNLLRILRGQHPNPASVKLLSERMIDKMSNASRLVDKLLAKDLVERKSCEHDRRQVDIIITKKGLEVTALASKKIELATSNLSITSEESEQLSNLLDILRNGFK